jgi:hypothetical protein
VNAAAIISIIVAAIKAVTSLFDYLHSKQMIDAGKAQDKLTELQAHVDATTKAIQAREVQRARDLSLADDKLRDDNDGWRRD